MKTTQGKIITNSATGQTLAILKGWTAFYRSMYNNYAILFNGLSKKILTTDKQA